MWLRLVFCILTIAFLNVIEAEKVNVRTVLLDNDTQGSVESSNILWKMLTNQRGLKVDQFEVQSNRTESRGETVSMLTGLVVCVCASLLLGTVFVPIKRHPMGDGFFVQLLLNLGAFCVSALVHGVVLSFPPLYPPVMIGGAMWCFGNAFAIKVMNVLGMALSCLIWNAVSCVMGWATSRFGLFGTAQSVPASRILNYIGVIILVIGSTFYIFIKSDLTTPTRPSSLYLTDTLPQKNKLDILGALENEDAQPSPIQRTLAILSALAFGLLFGSMLTPQSYMLNHPDIYGTFDTLLVFGFSFFVGAFIMSIAIFTVYCLAMKGSPQLDPQIALPSLVAGILTGMGLELWVLGTELLSPTIAYPMCTMLPGLVISLWSVLYFKEIAGKRNISILCGAYLLTLTGVILVALSRNIEF